MSRARDGLGVGMVVIAMCFAAAQLAAAQGDDPFGEHTGAGGTSPTTGVTAALPHALTTAAACAEISSSICARANTNFLTMAGGYVAVALLLCVAWTILWSGRSPSGAGMKFMVPLVIGALVATCAVGFDPFASENYLCCIGDPVMRATLLLGESRVARALVLGTLPFSVLYVVIVFIVRALRR